MISRNDQVLGNRDVQVSLIDAKELRKELYSDKNKKATDALTIPTSRITSKKHTVFKDFYYFAPEEIKDESGYIDEINPYFLIARDQNDNQLGGIVGVAKIEAWDFGGAYPGHWGSCFFDVREDRKRQGIAKRLIYELSTHLTPKDYLVGTCESDEGEMAGIHKMKREMVTVCPVFDEGDQFHAYCKYHGLLKFNKTGGAK